MYSAKMSTFWDIALIYDSMRLRQFFKVNFRPLPNLIFTASMGWMDHSKTFIKGCTVQTCVIFWDIAFISVCIGLSQFLEVKSTPHPNRFFMFFIL